MVLEIFSPPVSRYGKEPGLKTIHDLAPTKLTVEADANKAIPKLAPKGQNRRGNCHKKVKGGVRRGAGGATRAEMVIC